MNPREHDQDLENIQKILRMPRPRHFIPDDLDAKQAYAFMQTYTTYYVDKLSTRLERTQSLLVFSNAVTLGYILHQLFLK